MVSCAGGAHGDEDTEEGIMRSTWSRRGKPSSIASDGKGLYNPLLGVEVDTVVAQGMAGVVDR